MAQERYELLSLALSYPSQELMDLIEKRTFDKVFNEVAPFTGSLEDLEVEYCRLFVGPAHVEVPPYESVYRGHGNSMQKGNVKGSASIQVAEVYRKAGLTLNQEFTDLPDHIAVETLFIAYLESMKVVSPDEGFDEIQNQFVKNHLVQWAPVFADDVIKKTRNPWYSYIASLLTDIVIEQLRVE
ncbi:MAG TPA: molecular chaperone TorD family protein [Syntrophomonadaceae bacterium]|nr:molecular chaperone TorD family protein [Syntrophomonadaceae bacterium]